MKNKQPSVSQSNPRTNSARWFLIMNALIAITLVCGAALLKRGSDRYQPRAQFDQTYIIRAKAETNPEVLQKGLVYTEGARATAYKSMLNLSHGTSIIWLLVAIVFVTNSIFMFRVLRANQMISGKVTPA